MVFMLYFFQKFWDIIRDDIVGMVKNWWRGNIDLHNINKTHISLISKCSEPRSVASFRPISCCNVVYKIISKQWLISLKVSSEKLFLSIKVLLSIGDLLPIMRFLLLRLFMP